MRTFALAITVMLLLAVASLGMAFNVTVSVPDENHVADNQVYMTVEMQPVAEHDVKAAEAGDNAGADKEALLAEKE